VSLENEEQQAVRSTVGRSIRLSTDVMTRLQAVCEHLGVTVGAYLTQEIGRAVARDEVSLMAKQSKDNSLELLSRFLTEAAKEARDE
jgi:predicted DNA-binding protein